MAEKAGKLGRTSIGRGTCTVHVGRPTRVLCKGHTDVSMASADLKKDGRQQGRWVDMGVMASLAGASAVNAKFSSDKDRSGLGAALQPLVSLPLCRKESLFSLFNGKRLST